MTNKKSMTVLIGIVVPIFLAVSGMLLSLSSSVAVAQNEVQNLKVSLDRVQKSIDRVEGKLDRLRVSNTADHLGTPLRAESCPFALLSEDVAFKPSATESVWN